MIWGVAPTPQALFEKGLDPKNFKTVSKVFCWGYGANAPY